MRVLLMHNPTAGEREPSADGLLAILREEGLDPTYQSTKEKKFAEPLARSWDLVIVAGGDGAVADVANGLTGPEIPFTILPLGTANNFADSLGIRGTPRQIVRGMREPIVRALRPGVASGPWGARTIWEGAGVGLFPRLIRMTKSSKGKGSPPAAAERLLKPLLLWAAELADLRPIPIRAVVDGEQIRGDFLMAEVPILPLLGPNLPLSPHAEPGDARLDLVLVGEDERTLLMDYLIERINGREDTQPPALPVLSGESIRIEWSGSPVRLDDELWPEEEPDDAAGTMTVEVGDDVRTVWVPRGA